MTYCQVFARFTTKKGLIVMLGMVDLRHRWCQRTPESFMMHILTFLSFFLNRLTSLITLIRYDMEFCNYGFKVAQ